jgi:hypothetical protein
VVIELERSVIDATVNADVPAKERKSKSEERNKGIEWCARRRMESDRKSPAMWRRMTMPVAMISR